MSLFITVGAPGAGKSTWAEGHLGPLTLRLERDRFREALFGSRRAYHDHGFARPTKSMVVTDAMMAAMRAWPCHDWAVTDTGLIYGAVSPFINFARTRNATVIIVLFNRSREYLRRINKTRPVEQRIPPALLEDMINDFESEEAWWKNLPADTKFRIMEAPL